MSTPICLVFPHQLFEQHPAFAHADAFWLIEDELFFTKLPFHQKKLALHRASMNYYAEYLRSNSKEVRYFEEKEAKLEVIFDQLRQMTTQLIVVDPTDFLLEKRIRRYAQQFDNQLTWLQNPSFINSPADNKALFGQREKRFFMADFYKKQRERLGILLDQDGQALGGRWSFDTENRKALPKGLVLPVFPIYASQWALRSAPKMRWRTSGL